MGLLRSLLAPVGVELALYDLCNFKVGEIIREEQPDVSFVETLSNPLVKVTDLDAVSVAAREVGALSIVGNTFPTPYLLRPIEHRFDLVVRSATNYLGRHGHTTARVGIRALNNLVEQLRPFATML